mgnify:CR=1 FL=1
MKIFQYLTVVMSLVIGSSAFACGGNQCTSPSDYVFGRINSGGGFIGEAVGGNQATGHIINRFTESRTGGHTSFEGMMNLDTCDSGNCTNRLRLNGDGSAFAHQSDHISSQGGGSSTASQGASALDMSGSVELYRYNQ